MSLHIRSELIRDGKGRIEYRYLHKSGREHFHVRLCLEEPEETLRNVVIVDYLLHQSFKKRLRRSSDRDGKFAVTIWTYGMFLANATIHYRDGYSENVPFYVTFDLPEDDGGNYVMVPRTN